MVTVRKATTDDMDQLTQLLHTLFTIEEDFTCNEPRQRCGLQLILRNPAALIMVAETESTVIGMCSGQLTISTAEGGLALLVEDLVVKEEYRGLGAGRKLAESLELWADGNGVSRLQLLADRCNEPALDFYNHLGWQSTQLICLRKRI